MAARKAHRRRHHRRARIGDGRGSMFIPDIKQSAFALAGGAIQNISGYALEKYLSLGTIDSSGYLTALAAGYVGFLVGHFFGGPALQYGAMGAAGALISDKLGIAKSIGIADYAGMHDYMGAGNVYQLRTPDGRRAALNGGGMRDMSSRRGIRDTASIHF